MKRIFFLLLIVSIVSCKSDNTYNSVVEEAKKNLDDIPIAQTTNDSIQNVEKEFPDLNDTVSDQFETLSKEVEIPSEKAIAPPKSRSKKAQITFENTIFEFGEIEEGDIVEHKFYFTNTGEAALNIKNTSATCGCTVPSYPFIPIEPGEKGYIGVVYNSVGKSGKQLPTITVVSNAQDPVVKISLSGTVTEKKKEEKKKVEAIQDTLPD